MIDKNLNDMKSKLLFLFITLFIFGACNNEPRLPHIYEQNPNYTFMGVSFFGQFYENIPYYVFSFTFFSDGMLNEDSTAIAAPGQHLFIEDFFVPRERLDFLQNVEEGFVLTEKQLLEMLQGEYRASGKVGSDDFGTALTFAPGEVFEVDNAAFILGARITYHEENPFFSRRMLITEGTFTISTNGVVFDLQTEDGFRIGGKYQSPRTQIENQIKVQYSSKRKFEQK